MTCNYFEYRDMTEKLFFGTLLTQEHLNNATEEIRRYIVDGGAGDVMLALGIGIKVITKDAVLLPKEMRTPSGASWTRDWNCAMRH